MIFFLPLRLSNDDLLGYFKAHAVFNLRFHVPEVYSLYEDQFKETRAHTETLLSLNY